MSKDYILTRSMLGKNQKKASIGDPLPDGFDKDEIQQFLKEGLIVEKGSEKPKPSKNKQASPSRNK